MDANQNLEEKSLSFDVPVNVAVESIVQNELGTWKVRFRQITYSARHCYSGYISNTGNVKFDDLNITMNFMSNNGTVYVFNLDKIGEYNYYFYTNLMIPQTASKATIKIEYKEKSIFFEANGPTAHLKELLETGKNADVTIKAGKKELKAHKLILMRSEFFDKMLNSDHTKESQTGIIKVTEDYEVIYEVCRYLYYGQFDTKFAKELLVTSDKYLIKDLVLECEQYLMKYINMDNFFDILINADKVQADKLKDAVIQYIIENRNKVFVTNQWKELKEKHIPLAMLVMEQFMLTHN